MSTAKKTRGKKVQRTCACCCAVFLARQADVNRGWGKFCSKRCKAVDQEKRTGQYRDQIMGQGNPGGLHESEMDFDEDMMGATTTHGQDPQDSYF